MLTRRFAPLYLLCFVFVLFWFLLSPSRAPKAVVLQHPFEQFTKPPNNDVKFNWAQRKEEYPVSSMIPLPTGIPPQIPTIQHAFGNESPARAAEITKRRNTVKATFDRTWEGYKNYAWMKDELAPITGVGRNRFGGWAATLVDTLDTLWIMEKTVDFEQAVANVKDIDFSKTEDEELNVFETTIRYLGGLLAANDLSDGKYPQLLEKALEVGNLLYAAFDTPNRMPITRWKWQNARYGHTQEVASCLVAEIGSLSLEFTRLSQVSGESKFYDAIQRISDRFEVAQNLTKLPGLWPVVVNPNLKDLGGDTGFTIGAMADSLYEYLPKQYLLLAGLIRQPKILYERSIEAAKKHLFFRPMTKDEADILVSGDAHVDTDKIILDAKGQHLSCFAGGMMGIGAKIFNRPDDLPIARKLVDGCIWAYNSMPTGIMPEVFHMIPCVDMEKCSWDENNKDSTTKFPGYSSIGDTRYVLRPEAIESIFILYRITGDPTLQDAAWKMFQSIELHTKTQYGAAALDDITKLPPPQANSMESFWTAETLKYFYLIFSPEETISLDKWVLNTEAHPFRRPN